MTENNNTQYDRYRQMLDQKLATGEIDGYDEPGSHTISTGSPDVRLNSAVRYADRNNIDMPTAKVLPLIFLGSTAANVDPRDRQDTIEASRANVEIYKRPGSYPSGAAAWDKFLKGSETYYIPADEPTAAFPRRNRARLDKAMAGFGDLNKIDFGSNAEPPRLSVILGPTLLNMSQLDEGVTDEFTMQSGEAYTSPSAVVLDSEAADRAKILSTHGLHFLDVSPAGGIQHIKTIPLVDTANKEDRPKPNDDTDWQP